MGFQCQQFYLKDEHCAMKVGTDSLILGSWCPLPTPTGALRVLDVGTGCGILSLMLAQRLSHAGQTFQIDALELDAGAVADARDNVAASSWAAHIQVIHSSAQAWQQQGYDLVICNPPYFPAFTGAAQAQGARGAARQQHQLSLQALFAQLQRWLTPTGSFVLVYPQAGVAELLAVAGSAGFELSARLRVKTTERKGDYLQALQLKRHPTTSVVEQRLCIRTGTGAYTPAFRALTGAFYLTGQAQPCPEQR